MKPWSTNTHVSRSPIARWTSGAATLEATPPESPQIARPAPPPHTLEECRQHLLAVRRVDPRGVELDAADAALGRLERRHRGGGRGGERGEAGRGREHRVAMRHPARLLGRRARREPAAVGDGQLRASELPDLGPLDPPAQGEREQLHPVTDAEHRDAQLEQLLVEGWRALLIDGRRPAGENHALGAPSPDLLDPDVMGQQFGEDAALADPAGDQLRVLASEVEDDDLFGRRTAITVRTGPPGPRDAERSEACTTRHLLLQPSAWRPCRRPARAGGACPPSAAPARPRARGG